MVSRCASSFGCPLGSNTFSRTIGVRGWVLVAKQPPKVPPLLPLLTMGKIMDPGALGLAGVALVATQSPPAVLPGGQIAGVSHRPPRPKISTPAAAEGCSRCLPTLFRRPFALWLYGVAIPPHHVRHFCRGDTHLCPNYGRFRHASRGGTFSIAIHHFNPAVFALVAGFVIEELTRSCGALVPKGGCVAVGCATSGR